jgi:type II secretory pathway predicted ATPase ExeA
MYYEEYWNITEEPFQNTPDPRFLYYSKEHKEGLFRLLYAVEGKKGAAMLTGVFGCGKTVLARALLAKLNRNIYQIVLINNPHLTSVELLRSIARQLGAENLPEKLTEMSADHFLQVIEEILLNNIKDGKETVIIIDEMHVIKENDILEELRLLLNFQLENRFLLTLILLGQSEFAERIRKNKQFFQRMAIAYSLGPLNEKETEGYIEHRLNVAQAQRQIFSPQTIRPILQNSGGIPRRINQICDMCLLTGFNYEVKLVDVKIVNEVVESLGV